jgi:hypothetical protein
MTVGKRRRPHVPYPELVDRDPEKGYRVVDIEDVSRGYGETKSDGMTDKSNRIMAVPMTPAGHYIARHEMGHAKWSPNKKPNSRTWLMRGCLEVCEEMRVNQGMARLGIPVVMPVDLIMVGTYNTAQDIEEGENIKVALRIVANLGTNAGVALMEVLERHIKLRNVYAIWLEGIIRKLEKKMKRARRRNQIVPPFSSCHRIARWLEKELRKMTKPKGDLDGQAQRVMGVIPFGFGDEVKMKPQARTFQGINGSMGGQGYYGGASHMPGYHPSMSPFYGHDWGQVPPGDMRIEEPRLTIPVTGARLEKKRCARSAEEGTEFRYIERFVSDQRVFKRRAKKRKGGGTVLIDTSGSMSLYEGDIAKIVADSPDATKIATYSGNGTEGTLRVVVNDGKRVTDGNFSTPGGSNVIDLPALEWLSCQPEPRVWLSDGCVTGIHDASSRSILEACNTIQRDNSITRVDTVEQVVKALRRGDVDVGMSSMEARASEYFPDDEDDDD